MSEGKYRRGDRGVAARALMALPLLAIAAPALAEEGASGEIVVTGRGLEAPSATTAYDVQVLDREELTTSASGRIEDVLSGIAGFEQFRRSDSRSSNPSAQGVTLRALGGNATSRALVLLDGVPMADPFFGYIPLSAIAPERLAMAQVTRGGGTGAFGAGAVAGTIDLVSAGVGELDLLSATALVDDRGETELSGTFAPELGRGFAVVSGRWDRGQGFWTTPVDQRKPASVRARYDSWSAGLRAVAPLGSDMELQARVLAFDDSRTLRFAGADSRSQGQDASIRLVGRGPWQFDVLAYVQARDFSSVVISSSSFKKTLDQYATPTTGAGGKIELRPPVGGGHVLRLGADLRLADGLEKEASYSAATGLVTVRKEEGGRNSDFGLFLEDDWSLGAVVLTAGARADRWTITRGFYRQISPAGVVTPGGPFLDRAGWEGTFRGGMVAKLGDGLSLRAAGYTGFRLPTLNELYRPFTVFPVVTQANAELTPERLRGFEAGIDYSPAPGLKLSLTAFDDRLRRAIANVTVANNLRQRQNVDAITARGIEADASLTFGQIRFDGSLAWTDAKVEASAAAAALDGMRPAQTPKLATSATLGWRPGEGWLLSATLRHFGAQFEDDLQSNVLPAVTLLNAYAQVPLGRGFSLVLRGENLTDAEVWTRNQSGSIDLGTPRTVWAGLRVSIGR